ncbi:MAG: hypothetical protein WCJ29_05110 [bacterium]
MEKKGNGGAIATIAVLGASLAGLAASAYFFFGPKGKANQKHAKAWAIKMKGDVVAKLEEAKDITEPIYQSIIDSVAKEYARDNKVRKEEINAIADDLKKHWKSMSKLATASKERLAKDAEKIAKKVKK